MGRYITAVLNQGQNITTRQPGEPASVSLTGHPSDSSGEPTEIILK
jgi:hypothetical protein